MTRLGSATPTCSFTAAAGQVTIRTFAVQEDVYPWQPGAEFRCSDEELNKIFQAGIRTVQLNSRDTFTDCPTREQQAWVGDSVVHQMVHLATNPDWRLAWHYLTLSDSPRYDGILPMTVVGPSEASGGMTIPDWSLHWVHGVYNLYRFTGDRDGGACLHAQRRARAALVRAFPEPSGSDPRHDRVGPDRLVGGFG